jgi:hypothetical protein
MRDVMVFKNVKKDSVVVLREATERYQVHGMPIPIIHKMNSQVDGMFSVNDINISYIIEPWEGKKLMKIGSLDARGKILDRPTIDRNSVVINGLLVPVIKALAERDNLEVAYPEWLKASMASYEKIKNSKRTDNGPDIVNIRSI